MGTKIEVSLDEPTILMTRIYAAIWSTRSSLRTCTHWRNKCSKHPFTRARRRLS
jgi:hypothetical protein